MAGATFHHPFMHLLCVFILLLHQCSCHPDGKGRKRSAPIFGREFRRVAEMAIRHITVDVLRPGTGFVGAGR